VIEGWSVGKLEVIRKWAWRKSIAISSKRTSGPTGSSSPVGFRPGALSVMGTKKSGQEDFSWPVNAARL
jgi:hypothetical protein